MSLYRCSACGSPNVMLEKEKMAGGIVSAKVFWGRYFLVESVPWQGSTGKAGLSSSVLIAV